MLLIDDRQGSGHLAKPLEEMGLPVQVTRLDYADFAFSGTGPDGEVVSVGVELKKVKEIVTDITDARFSGHQLSGLFSSYDYCLLLVEGRYRCNHIDKTLEVCSGPIPQKSRSNWHKVPMGKTKRYWPYSVYMKHLLTLEFKTGIPIHHTDSEAQTKQFLAVLYSWWEEGWGAHRSHERVYERRTWTGRKTPLRESVALKLPWVGPRKAKKVAGQFNTTLAMINASEEEWGALEGIGDRGAKTIYTKIRSE